MEFYKDSDPETWTCTKVVEHYRTNMCMKELKQVLDYVKKDLRKVAAADSDFDDVRRQKAHEILKTWKVMPSDC